MPCVLHAYCKSLTELEIPGILNFQWALLEAQPIVRRNSKWGVWVHSQEAGNMRRQHGMENH